MKYRDALLKEIKHIAKLSNLKEEYELMNSVWSKQKAEQMSRAIDYRIARLVLYGRVLYEIEGDAVERVIKEFVEYLNGDENE